MYLIKSCRGSYCLAPIMTIALFASEPLENDLGHGH